MYPTISEQLLLAITYLPENKVINNSFLSPLSPRLRSFIFIPIIDIDAAVIMSSRGGEYEYAVIMM